MFWPTFIILAILLAAGEAIYYVAEGWWCAWFIHSEVHSAFDLGKLN